MKIKKNAIPYIVLGIIAVLIVGGFLYNEVKDYKPHKMVNVLTYGSCNDISPAILEHQNITDIYFIAERNITGQAQRECTIFYWGTQ